jgi:hypothetical protein
MSTIASQRCPRSGKARPRQRGPVRIASASLALIAVVSFEAAAHAATVRAVEGQVLVNAGQGYRLVDGSTQLEPGGTVVANPGAVAEVVYSGTCRVTVQPGSVYLVTSQPPCGRGEPAGTGGLTDTGGSSSGVGSGTAWALGAIAVVGGGAAAYFLIPPMSP